MGDIIVTQLRERVEDPLVIVDALCRDDVKVHIEAERRGESLHEGDGAWVASCVSSPGFVPQQGGYDDDPAFYAADLPF